MPQDKTIFSASIPSDLAHVSCARAFVTAACKSHGIDDKTTELIALAVHEAITNVIRHGHCHQYDKPIQLLFYPYSDRIEIHILDEGEPFDLDQVPELDPGELRLGGRGVFLMRTLFDQVSCQPRDGQGNHLRLVKFCPVKSPGSCPS
jgi:serine/threonine-protein kinase RsbW